MVPDLSFGNFSVNNNIHIVISVAVATEVVISFFNFVLYLKFEGETQPRKVDYPMGKRHKILGHKNYLYILPRSSTTSALGLG